MTAWSDYKSQARERGALALEVFVAESVPAGDGDKRAQILPRHLAYQRELEASGALVFAGPLSDESGDDMSGAGLIVYRADSMEAARKLAEADPMHAEGGRTYTLRRWLINEASVALNLNR